MLTGSVIDPTRSVPDAARRLEALGFDYGAVGEHVFFASEATNAFVTLAVAAGATTTLRLVSTITLLPLYPAALAAKMAAELQRLSGGRFELGIGMGGEFPDEFAACGVPVGERTARTEEGLTVIARLMREDAVTLDGRFTSLRGVTLNPRPDTPPPVWLGGRREKAMRRAARLADVWMPYLYTPEQFAHSMEVIGAETEAAGRGPDAVDGALFAWTLLGHDRESALEQAATLLSATYGSDMRAAAARYVLAGSVDDCAQRLAAYAAAGVRRVIFSPLAAGPDDRAAMTERIGSELLPQLGGL